MGRKGELLPQTDYIFFIIQKYPGDAQPSEDGEGRYPGAGGGAAEEACPAHVLHRAGGQTRPQAEGGGREDVQRGAGRGVQSGEMKTAGIVITFYMITLQFHLNFKVSIYFYTHQIYFTCSRHNYVRAGGGDDGDAVLRVPPGPRRPQRVQHPLVAEGGLVHRRESSRGADPPLGPRLSAQRLHQYHQLLQQEGTAGDE